jgi:hypothetical protein
MNFYPYVFVIITILAYTIVLSFFDNSHFNGIHDIEQSLFTKIFNRFYLITTTFSTVGYGDISPKSKTTKSIIISLQLLMIFEIIQLISFK